MTSPPITEKAGSLLGDGARGSDYILCHKFFVITLMSVRPLRHYNFTPVTNNYPVESVTLKRLGLFASLLLVIRCCTISPMNYVILIIIALAGIALGMYIARRNGNGLIAEQSAKKAENKKKILEFIQANEKIQNHDVEKLAGVSGATAERYLDELEKEGKLTQHGVIGQSVFYTSK